MGVTDALSALMAQAHAADARTRHKLGRTIGHKAMEIEKSDVELTQAGMGEVLGALGHGALVHTCPQRYHMSKSRLMARRRRMLGLSDQVVDQEKAKRLDIEVGGVVLRDGRLPFSEINPDWRAEFNAHRIFAVSFGGDGETMVRLRVLAAGPCEPMEAKFRRLRAATAEAVLELPTGRLVADGAGSKSLTLDAAPGRWRLVAFGFGLGRRNPQCLVQLAPLSGAPPPPLIDTLELPM